MHHRRHCFAVAVFALGMAACSSAPPQPFAQMVNEFVTESLAFSPVSATGSGYHQHRGQSLDVLVDDVSETGIDKQRAFYKVFQQRLVEREKAGGLTSNDKADIALMRAQIEWALLEFDRIQRYKHDPTYYTDLVGNALFSPLVLEYAPIETRYEHVIERLKRVPGVLGAARQNLVDAPPIMLDVALRANDANRDMIVKSLRETAPPGAIIGLDRFSNDAVRAINDFGDFLRNDLSKKKSDWRLGTEKYNAKFGPALGLTESPAELLADAEKELERVRKQALDLALPLDQKLFPKEPRDDPDQVVRRVLDKIAERHATPATYLDEARADLEQATAFVKAKDFVPMPVNSNLKVIPTPEFQRGSYAVGGFVAAPPLEPKLGAFYWVTPIAENAPKEEIESKLREYNRWGMQILTIHEAMPGHYLQFEFANTVQPAERRVLRSLFSNTPYVEGWAVYATELMIEQGYLDNEPEMKLNWYKQLLRVISNTILDVKMQTQGMTDEQALDLMINKTYQEKAEATAKVVRAKLTSAQLPTYFAGWREWRRLREAEQKRLGSAFNLKAFHEAALRAGAVRMGDLPSLLAE
jgi:uncharacterized protein (DUF885 family)